MQMKKVTKPKQKGEPKTVWVMSVRFNETESAALEKLAANKLRKPSSYIKSLFYEDARQSGIELIDVALEK